MCEGLPCLFFGGPSDQGVREARPGAATGILFPFQGVVEGFPAFSQGPARSDQGVSEACPGGSDSHSVLLSGSPRGVATADLIPFQGVLEGLPCLFSGSDQGVRGLPGRSQQPVLIPFQGVLERLSGSQ